MYMCYTPFFGENSVVKVIMSSGDYILIIYDMVLIKHHFLVRIQLSSRDYILIIYDMVITKQHFSVRIQL